MMRELKLKIYYIKNGIRCDLGISKGNNFTIACANLSKKNKDFEKRTFFDMGMERNVYMDVYGDKNVLKGELIKIME